MVRAKNITPLESDEARTLVAYLRVKGYKFTHIPGETGSSPEARRRAIRMKQQGYSKGTPDYMVIVNRQLLFVELKRVKGSVVSDEQREWLLALSTTGAHCIISHGAQETIDYIENVLTKP